MALLELDRAILDPRFEYLGELTGFGKYDARGRLIGLWSDCIQQTRDVRTAEEIDNLTGWFNPEKGSFADLLVRARLADAVEGGYRVRGVRDRMKWLVELRAKRRAAASIGGKKGAQAAGRGKDGRFGARPKSTEQTPEPAEQVLGVEPSKHRAKPSGSVSVSGSEEKEGKSVPRADAREATLPRLARIWNEACGDLPKVLRCSGGRRRHAENRWREDPDEDFWRGVIARIRASSFCTGGNARGWRADFDFFVRPDTANRVLEGKYDDPKGPRGGGKLRTLEDEEGGDDART